MSKRTEVGDGTQRVEGLIIKCWLQSDNETDLHNDYSNKNLTIHYTDKPRYQDLVIEGGDGAIIVIPTEHLPNLIMIFAEHLSIERKIKDENFLKNLNINVSNI